ncbi:MAG TPA: DUF6152 family protein [Steroidobacteraceae bacterium]|nr:DUF6152 family protein [Steroidobacteraceae bacterium]
MQVFRIVGPRVIALGALAAGLLAAGAAMAHHSFAMFDSEHQVKISGQITKFDWTNPHIYLFITGGETGAEAKAWTIEGASPGILNRVGWKFNMIKAGDKVTMVIAPLRSGEAGGLLKEIKLPDGRIFNNGGFAGPSTISLKDEP